MRSENLQLCYKNDGHPHLPRSVKSSEGNRSIKHFPRRWQATKYLQGDSSEFLSERSVDAGTSSCQAEDRRLPRLPCVPPPASHPHKPESHQKSHRKALFIYSITISLVNTAKVITVEMYYCCQEGLAISLTRLVFEIVIWVVFKEFPHFCMAGLNKLIVCISDSDMVLWKRSEVPKAFPHSGHNMSFAMSMA